MKLLRLMSFIAIAFTLISLSTPKAQAMDERAKVILTVAGYGTAGGALLGIASLAFGTEARAIAQGASLGLYAGIIFGSYIVLSHMYKTGTTGDEYPVDGGLYNEVPPIDGGNGQFWDDFDLGNQRIRDAYDPNAHIHAPSFGMDLFNMTF